MKIYLIAATILLLSVMTGCSHDKFTVDFLTSTEPPTWNKEKPKGAGKVYIYASTYAKDFYNQGSILNLAEASKEAATNVIKLAGYTVVDSSEKADVQLYIMNSSFGIRKRTTANVNEITKEKLVEEVYNSTYATVTSFRKVGPSEAACNDVVTCVSLHKDWSMIGVVFTAPITYVMPGPPELVSATLKKTFGAYKEWLVQLTQDDKFKNMFTIPTTTH